MLPFQLPQLIVDASADAYLISQYSAYTKETIDGETRNRIWSFFSTYTLTTFALLPLTVLFPVINVWFILLGSACILGSIFYVASIAQMNQISKNLEEFDKITALPWGLHENTYLTKTALFLSINLTYPLLMFYGVSLVACLFLGAPLYACASLAMYALDQLYQHEYIPEFLETPYVCMSVILMISVAFGITSTLGMTLSLAMITFTVIDYVRCQYWKNISPTAQFPMSDVSKHTSIPRADNVTLLLETYQAHRKESGIHVTFDHFYKSHQLVDELLADVPKVDYKGYIELFNQIDFNDETVQKKMLFEMRGHDKFNGKALSEHCVALGLPRDTVRVAVQKAYLKREMNTFVHKLQQSSFRDFTHIQIASMHGYARLLLSHIKKHPPARQAEILLDIATTTGSNCLRAYLESLSSRASEEGLFLVELTQHIEKLTLNNEALLKIQDVREAAFRTYYCKVTSILKKIYFYFNLVWADTNDYLTYEDFVLNFGKNFYLLNANFTSAFRDITAVMFDAMLAFIFSCQFVLALVCSNEKILFKDYYTVDYLVEQAIHPENKLFNLFKTWCDEHHVKLLDEDRMLIQRDAGELEALAELMLLDLNIVELDKPDTIQKASRHVFFQPAPLSTDNVVPSLEHHQQQSEIKNINHANR